MENSDFMLECQLIRTKLVISKGSLIKIKLFSKESRKKGEGKMWYCNEHQTSKCPLSESHVTIIGSKTATIHHILLKLAPKYLAAFGGILSEVGCNSLSGGQWLPPTWHIPAVHIRFQLHACRYELTGSYILSLKCLLYVAARSISIGLQPFSTIWGIWSS